MTSTASTRQVWNGGCISDRRRKWCCQRGYCSISLPQLASAHLGHAFDTDAVIRALVRDDARNAQIVALVLELAGGGLPHFDRLVLALPTADPSWILQQAGRIMRPADHKRDAVIYDTIDSSPMCLARLADRRVRHLREALDWTS